MEVEPTIKSQPHKSKVSGEGQPLRCIRRVGQERVQWAVLGVQMSAWTTLGLKEVFLASLLFGFIIDTHNQSKIQNINSVLVRTNPNIQNIQTK